jgi:hypothetical protein
MFTFILAAAVAPAPIFVADSPAADRPVGKLLALTPDGAELETPDGKRAVPGVFGLRRANAPLPPLPLGPALVTTTGDRVPGKLVGGDANSLFFQPSLGKLKWTVPVSSAAVVWLTKPPADTPTDIAQYSWLPENRRRDILLFRNGDTLRGTLDGFTENPTALKFAPEAGDARSVALYEVAALAFNPALARGRKPKGPYYQLVLRDGTRVAASTATVRADALAVRTLFGEAVEVLLTEVVALSVIQGRATYLADLKPAKVEETGFLGTVWPHAANRTVRGEPLRLLTALGEETFDRGLGTHPRTVLTYNLGGKFGRFDALVGLDAVSGPRGRADVRVLVDGKEQPLPELRKLSAGPAVAVRVDVSGAKELTLVVDFGPAGGVQADVNWADARLVE